jgi:hypothetical protein
MQRLLSGDHSACRVWAVAYLLPAIVPWHSSECVQMHQHFGKARPHPTYGDVALVFTSSTVARVACRERRRRRAKVERRRSRQRRRRQGEVLSDSGSELDSASDAAAGDDDGEGVLDGEAGALVLAGQGRRKRSKGRGRSRRKRRSRQGEEGAAGDEGGSSASASDSEASDDETAEARERRRAVAAAAIGGRTLPKIMFQLAPEDRPEAGAAARGSGSDSWASEDDAGHGRSRAGSRRVGGVTTDGDDGATGADSDGGGAAVPERIAKRIAQKRHRWTPQQDRQLLCWVVAQRVELGTRGQVRRGRGFHHRFACELHRLRLDSRLSQAHAHCVS